LNQKAFLSIGSNIDAKTNIKKVKNILDSYFDVTYSSIIQTSAEGFKGKDFLNLVCFFDTKLNPNELTDLLKNIEKNMGRTVSQKGMSDRIIDLDLILYGDLILKRDGIEVPSSDITKYKFILDPLVEIAGDYRHPETNKTFTQSLSDLKVKR
jgi:2-amino-4-hydroxy-6-hydroxymethyldihydropteridine diphosphokinase|tara:strand:- start:1124 stop:1582 length:459 start_codon:yes stop_codon:yes gene_type:complete